MTTVGTKTTETMSLSACLAQTDYLLGAPDDAKQDQQDSVNRDRATQADRLARTILVACADFYESKNKSDGITEFLDLYAQSLNRILFLCPVVYVDLCAVIDNHPQTTNQRQALIRWRTLAHIENSLKLASEAAQRQNMKDRNTETLSNIQDFCRLTMRYFSNDPKVKTVRMAHKKSLLILNKVGEILNQLPLHKRAR